MLTFDVITLFPQLFEPHLKELPFKRAIEKNKINVNLRNLRDFALDARGTVDDKPYGGGVGMILMIEPLYNMFHHIYKEYYSESYPTVIEKQNELTKIIPPANDKIIVLTPTGKKYSQAKAEELTNQKHITFVCGRYEGIDARITEIANVELVSIGNFVVSGGEVPALAVMESVTRLLPGVLEKETALHQETFTNNKVEYPQYTRPENFKGVRVPEILLSGHHKKIEEWKQRHSKAAY